MKEVRGNIWDYYDKGNWVVITTNGVVKANGEAVMGKGIALQAAKRFPLLPSLLGKKIMAIGSGVFNFTDYRLITFPTKQDWRKDSDVDLIRLSADKLVFLTRWLARSGYFEFSSIFPLYMTRPGCGSGGLDWKDVKPILEKVLDDRFIVVQN